MQYFKNYFKTLGLLWFILFASFHVYSQGTALHFDGSNDHVTTSAKSTLVSGSFTVMAWVKPENATKAMHIFSTRETAEFGFDMQLTGGNKIHADIGNGTSFMTTAADANYNYTVGRWLHVAYTVTAGTYKIYANGKLLTTATLGAGTPLLLNATHKIVIGKNASESTNFQGAIDEVKVYNAVLTESDIKADMLSSTPSVPANLVAHYNFNQTGTTLTDLSGNGYDGVVTNFALTGTSSNWVESYAMVVPTITTATNILSSGFTANWTAPANGTLDNYVLEVAKDNGFTNPISGSPFSVNALSQQITGLLSNTDYYYRVKANKNTIPGQGANSDTEKVTTTLAYDFLSSLSLTGVSISPSFNSAQLNYSAVTSNTSLQLQAVQANIGSTIEMKVNGSGFTAISTSVLSPIIPLNLGNNVIELRVTDGPTSRIYTLSINRVNPTIHYVTESGAGTKDGTSWNNASDDLQQMISAATPHDLIWVAKGVYKPIRRGDDLIQISLKHRRNSFVLSPDIKIYGGFIGTETMLEDRNYVQNETILSGDFNGDDVVTGGKNTLVISNHADNSYHVVLSRGAVGYALLDGFTITGGRADGGLVINPDFSVHSYDFGGGLSLRKSSPTLRNLKVKVNSGVVGGGIFAEESQSIIENVSINSNRAQGAGGIAATVSNLTLNNVTVNNNRATTNGGGMSNSNGSAPTITNSRFFGNYAVNDGGGIYNTDAAPVLLNVSITDNMVIDYGGGMSSRDNSAPQLTNVLIANNEADLGGGMLNAETTSAILTNVTITKNRATSSAGGVENKISGTAIIRNSIIWDNYSPVNKVIHNESVPAVVTHSLVEGGYTGTGNISVDPQFRDPANRNYQLGSNSPAVNAGSSVYYAPSQTPDISAVNKDLNDRARVNGTSIDMGAYEDHFASAALHFDGVDDQVTFGATPTTVSGDFTVQIWVRPTEVAKTMHILSTKTVGGFGFDLQLKNGNTVHANIGSANAWLSNAADMTYDYSAGRWMHIAYSVSSTGFKAYLNGELKASGAFSGTPLLMDTNHQLQLGYDTNNSNTFFNGELDELRIYNKALTDTEINQEMVNESSVLSNQLLAHYNFNQGVPQDNNSTNTILEDIGLHHNTGTLVGFTLNGAQSNWVESYAQVVTELVVPISLSPSSFEARWKSPKLGLVDNGYTLEIATDSDFSMPIAGSPFNITTENRIFSGLPTNTSYYYRVAADKQSVTGNGAFSPVMIVNLQTFTPPGNALNLDGTNDHVVMQPKATVVKDNFTVMAWVKPEHSTKAMHILSTREGGDQTFDMQLTGGNKIHGDIGAGTSWDTNNADADYKYNINQWLHVAYVVSPRAYKIYANGKEVGGGVLTKDPVLLGATHYITIGKNATENTYFKGSIDEVRIYSQALTEADIKQNMLNTAITHPSALLAHYNFDQGVNSKSDVLTDQGINGYHGTLKGFALEGNASNWVESYAMAVPNMDNVTNIKGTKFTANWTAPLIGTVDNGYLLEVATDEVFTQMITNSPFSINDTHREIIGLTTGTNYYYRVKADKNSVTGQGAVSEVKTVTPVKESQTINFAALDPKTTNSADFVLGATATSGLEVSYTSSNTAVAEVYQDNGIWKVKIKGEGIINITAKQAGDADYSAAGDVPQQLIVVEAPLPITLVSYTAKIEGNSTKLRWQTSSETNNKGFIIYRSGDYGLFVKIGEVSATHNTPASTDGTSSVSSYTFIDKQPLNGNNYYKLVQVDNDGTATELGVKPLTYNLKLITYNVFPNPTKDKVTITFAAGDYHTLKVIDMTGRVLQTTSISLTASEAAIHLANYASGVYLLLLEGKQGAKQLKVTKQ